MASGADDRLLPPTQVAGAGETISLIQSVDLSETVLADRYRIIRRLGAGGMGTVYLAEHIAIRKLFAVKVLSEELWSNKTAIARFLQEARTASQIHHQNVVQITDFGYSNKTVPFIVMELLKGEDLSVTITREGAMPWHCVRELLLQILAALEAAHAQGIIHRDMKPQNCFLVEATGDDRVVKVLDFGLAKVIRDDAENETLTRTGTLMGTPHYMPPEQANCEPLDVRADVYSAGVIAFQLLTGRVPYEGRSFMSVLSKLLTEDIPSMASVAPAAKIHTDVEAIVRRAMAKDRADRYASAAEFSAAIRELPVEIETTRRNRWPWIAASLVGLSAVVATTIWGSASLKPEVAGGQTSASTLDVDARAHGESGAGAAPEPAAAAPTVGAGIPSGSSADIDGDAAEQPHPPELVEPQAESLGPKPKPTNKAPQRDPAAQPKLGSEQASEPGSPPTTLSDAAMQSVRVATEAAVLDCSEVYLSTMSTVKVEFVVSPEGKVTRARTQSPLDGTDVGNCAATAVRAQTFPTSQMGVSKTWTMRLR